MPHGFGTCTSAVYESGGRGSMEDAHGERKDTAVPALSAAEDQPIHAPAHVAEVGRVATNELDDGAAGVAYFGEGLTHGGPVYVAVTEVHPSVSVFLALEVFKVDLDDALAQGANPVLRIAVKQHVANIKPSLDPRALELADLVGHFERTPQNLVPHFLDGNHDLQLLSKRNELTDLLLRTRPGVAVGRLRIYNGRNEQHDVGTPEFGIVQ